MLYFLQHFLAVEDVSMVYVMKLSQHASDSFVISCLHLSVAVCDAESQECPGVEHGGNFSETQFF